MKLKTFLASHRPLVKDVATSACLIGASAGIVFGVSAGTFKVNYINVDSAAERLASFNASNYRSEDIDSGWNMNESKDAEGNTIPAYPAPTTQNVDPEWWKAAHGADSKMLNYCANEMKIDADVGTDIGEEAIKRRYQYSAMVIDGATHSTMDRSFNQGLYEGLVDFVKNKACTTYDSETLRDPVANNIAHSYKPSADNTTEFVNIYLSSVHEHDVIGLAGFNHATPLNSLMIHEVNDGQVNPLVTCSNAEANKEVNSTGFILLDSNIGNNQNIASVQFRADQPGFLTGMATCQYFYNNLDMYHDKFQDLSVGIYGGVAIPTVTIYMGGFERGVELFNIGVLYNSINTGARDFFNIPWEPDDVVPPEETQQAQKATFYKLLEHSRYKDEINALPKNHDGLSTFQIRFAERFYDEFSVKIIKLGDVSTHFSGTFASGDAIGITKQYLNRGASAIIAVAGPQSLDTAQEIQNQNSKCIVIGVDTAMENSDYQRYHKGCDESTKINKNENDAYVDRTVAPDGSSSQQANAIIKFSAIKDIKSVSNRITKICAEGKNWDVSLNPAHEDKGPDPLRSVCGPGYQTCGNILNGLISISFDGFYNLCQAFQHFYFLIDTANDPIVGGISFNDAWNLAARSYISSVGEDWELVDAKYKEACTNITNLMTFKRTDEQGNPTPIYANYNHTTGILGSLLSLFEMPFDANMTLIPNDPLDLSKGFKTLDEGTIVPLSVLTWLDYNMYFLC